MRAEPHVDAADMEAVAALRQDADFVPSDEFRQADGAVREFGIKTGGEGLLGEGAEGLLLEAFVGGRGRRSGASVVEGGKAAQPGAASDGKESQHAEYRAEERGKYYDVV